ncbi:hypothetical protein [Chryseolinea sp. T2]|uniref:hypothetical protein n=1 Tax=Chryseolinea sp. T2 TaxID=3129255 RepID=UPI003076CDFF
MIKSLENLSEDLLELVHTQYPNGYESSITRITNAKREPIFVFPLETDDATYLVKVPVTKNSEGEYDVDSKGEGGEFEKGEEGFEPGDNFESGGDSGGGDEEEESSDYDDEGGGRKGREQSYDPDFDN